jgi:SulP family sulfate permease
MFGFVNGLANYILIPLDQFKTIVNGESVWLSGSPYIMLGLVLMTIAIVLLFFQKKKNF